MSREEVLRLLEQATADVSEALARRDRLIVQALYTGVPLRVVAETAGVSVSTVHRIRRAAQS